MKSLNLPKAILVMSLAAFPASACLWLEGTTIDGFFGRVASPDATPKRLTGFVPMIARDQKQLFELSGTAPSDPVSKANDKAVRALLQGKAQEAVIMLEEISAGHPDSYYTAANLGTAYELAGDDQQALKWILKGLELNPHSHMETEWIHARILETKIQLKTDPSWLSTHTITETDFLKIRDSEYRLKTRQGEMSGRDIWTALYRQLSVRMLLVKPSDRIVAQLLKELSIAESQLGALEYAEEYAKLAVQYGMPAEEMRESVLKWREIIKRAAPK